MLVVPIVGTTRIQSISPRIHWPAGDLGAAAAGGGPWRLRDTVGK